MNHEPAVDWTQANRHYLAAAFARIGTLLAGESADEHTATVAAALAEMPAAPAIDRLAEAFDLSTFERDLLLLCAGIEMDAAVAARCQALGQPTATFALALATLPEPHWSALSPVRPLRQWRLIERHGDTSLTQGRLSIDERVLHYLAGLNSIDERLEPLVRSHAAPPVLAATQAAVVADVLASLKATGDAPPLVQLLGDDPDGRRDVAATVAAHLGLALHVMRADAIPRASLDRGAVQVLWEREALLLGSALLIDGEGVDDAVTTATFAGDVDGLVFAAGREPLRTARAALTFTVDRPLPVEQTALWNEALGDRAPALEPTIARAAGQFRLSAREIGHAAVAIPPHDATRADPASALWQACRSATGCRLDGLAERVEPVATWADLILPEPQLATLRAIAVHVRHRATVYDGWGFADKCRRGLGISVLFAGESGTGKTMAAEVLANELQLELYRIDLAATVSKYVGDTEKNLARLFDAAENSGAILLFDEADALFGRRSEVRDSRDRWANIEVSYLLQRMDGYRGLAILTTNQKPALDTAFARRMRFVVPFAFPDQPQRERIWRGVFPAEAPLDGLDFAKLARLSVAGGSIRNIALGAAFLAAEARAPITMSHLLGAARAEGSKRDRPWSDAETRGWV
jgi:hypothetical protein